MPGHERPRAERPACADAAICGTSTMHRRYQQACGAASRGMRGLSVACACLYSRMHEITIISATRVPAIAIHAYGGEGMRREGAGRDGGGFVGG